MMGGHRAFTVRFDDVVVDDPARSSAAPTASREQELRRVANTAVALVCLDLVGVGEAVLQRTVDYTKLRHQFGRPIASFQAAQHLVANMHIALGRGAAGRAVGGVLDRRAAAPRPGKPPSRECMRPPRPN